MSFDDGNVVPTETVLVSRLLLHTVQIAWGVMPEYLIFSSEEKAFVSMGNLV